MDLTSQTDNRKGPQPFKTGEGGTHARTHTHLALGDFVDLLLRVAGADLEDVDHALLEGVKAAHLADEGADDLDALGGALEKKKNPNTHKAIVRVK